MKLPPSAAACACFVLLAGLLEPQGLAEGPRRVSQGLALLSLGTTVVLGSWPPLLLSATLLAAARSPAPTAPIPQEIRAVSLRFRVRQSIPAESGFHGWADQLCTAEGQTLAHPSLALPWRSALPLPSGRVLVTASWVRDARGYRLQDVSILAVEPGSWPVLEGARQWVRQRLQTRLQPQAAGMARALLLGEREGLSAEQRHTWWRWGLLHLLAVSGFHFYIWHLLLARLTRHRFRWARLLLLMLLAALAGGRPSAMRAVTMLSFREVAAARGFFLPPSALWSGALALELCFFPRAVDLGLVLSYAAAAALLACPSGGPWLARCLRASAAAWCATAPFLHARSGCLQPWGILATPLVALSMGLRMLAAALTLLPGGAGPAQAIFDLLDALDRPWEQANLPGAPLPLPAWPSSWIFGLCFAGLALLLGDRFRYRLALACLLCGGLAGLWVQPAPPGVVAIPMGHGAALVLGGPQHTTLFDFGTLAPEPALAAKRLYPALHQLGWPVPAWGMASHPDADHQGGLGPFLRPDRIPPVAGGFQVHPLPELELWLHGLHPTLEQSNSGGVLAEIRAPSFRAILPGDGEGADLRQLRQSLAPGPVDLLLLPHHGRSTDGLAELLHHLQPDQVWLSCGWQPARPPALDILEQTSLPWTTTRRGLLFLPLDSLGK